jgi:hypothetical protein
VLEAPDEQDNVAQTLNAVPAVEPLTSRGMGSGFESTPWSARLGRVGDLSPTAPGG